jgi:hypothetical protein
VVMGAFAGAGQAHSALHDWQARQERGHSAAALEEPSARRGILLRACLRRPCASEATNHHMDHHHTDHGLTGLWQKLVIFT